MSIKVSELIAALQKTVAIEGDFKISNYEGLKSIELGVYAIKTSDILVGITKDIKFPTVKLPEPTERTPQKVTIKQPFRRKGKRN